MRPMVVGECEPVYKPQVSDLYILPDDRILLGVFNGYALLDSDGGNPVLAGSLGASVNVVTASASHIYVGGRFTSTSASAPQVTSSHVARYELTGEAGVPDVDWNNTVGDTFKKEALALLVDSDGGLLVGGEGGLIGTDKEALVRLHPEVGLDTAYIPRQAPRTLERVMDLAPIPNSTDVYASFASGAGDLQRIPRSGATSSAEVNGGWLYDDSDISTSLNDRVIATADGDAIVVGPGFLARVRSDGTEDVAFATNLSGGPAYFSNHPTAVAAHTRDGQPGFIISGPFDTFGGVSVSGVARINADGTPDATFNQNVAHLGFSSANPGVLAVGVQSDGKIVAAGGQFGPFEVSHSAQATSPAKNIFRLNADGTIDPDFNVGSSPEGGCADPVGQVRTVPEPTQPPAPAPAPAPVIIPPTTTTTSPGESDAGPRFVSPETAEELTSEPGTVMAMVDGQPVPAEQSRVDVPAAAVPPAQRTPEQVAAVQAAGAELAAQFNMGGKGTQVTVDNTATGAELRGLLVDREDSSIEVPVPVEDVVLVTAAETRVLLAGADEEGRPVRVPTGVLEVTDGGLVAAIANGFAAGTPGEVVLLSTPRLIGSFTTGTDGDHAGQYELPADIEPGEHTLVLTTGDRTVALGLIVAPVNSEAATTPATPEADTATLPATGTTTPWWIVILVLAGAALLGVRRRLT